MKKLIIIFLILFAVNSYATTYYVSSSGGNDSNNGLTTGTAWQTLSKVNATSFNAGDIISFNGGDTFYGSLVISNSGSSGNPITYNSYGTGNAIITGFTTVSTWSNLGGNIWESSNAVSSLSSCNMVSVNGVNTPMGRYPNTGYLTYQSFSTNTSITSSNLTGTPNWTGASVVIKKYRYVIENHPITAQSGGTLTYSGGGANGQNNWGFIIQNDIRTLDTANEWYYNSSTKKIDVYSTSTPTNVQVSSVSSVIYVVNKSYIVFDGLNIIGGNTEAIHLGTSSNISIQNCNLNFNYYGIVGYQLGGSGSSNLLVTNNTINNTGTNAISLPSEFAGTTITGNLIKNTGMIAGMASSGQTRWGMNLTGNNYTIVSNEVDSTGYTGIGFNGSSVLCDKNIVNNYCSVTDDGGGIYNGNPQTGVVISNNTVLNGIGANAGANSSGSGGSANGIYCDDNSSGMSVINNSIANTALASIYLHNPTSPMVVSGNTTFNANVGLLVNRDNTSAHTTGINVKHNIFVGNNTGSMNTPQDQLSVWFKTAFTSGNDITTFGTVDSNYYARPISDGNTIQGTVYGVADTYYTLASWQTYSGYDAHTNKSPKSVTSKDSVSFFYNATASSSVITLPYNYIGITGTSYNGAITLQPYTSAVLIQNGSATGGTPPVVNAGSNQIIYLPATSTTMSGTVTPASGHTATYLWSTISGGGTPVFSDITILNPVITALTIGSHVFRLTATQDDSQTGYANVTVTVNSSTIQILSHPVKQIYINR